MWVLSHEPSEGQYREGRHHRVIAAGRGLNVSSNIRVLTGHPATARPLVGRFLPWIALVGIWFLWGSTYIGIRYAVRTIPPYLMGGSRYCIAGGLLLLIVAVRYRGLQGVTLRQVLSAGIAGSAMLLGGNGLVSVGEQHLQSGVAALLVATVPLVMTVETAVVRGRGLPARSVGAIALGSAGVVMLVGAPGTAVNYMAAGAVFLGAFFWATGSVYLTVAELPRNPLITTGLEMGIGGALMLLVGLATGELGSLHLAAVTQASVLGWLWLIGPGALLGFSAYTYALKTLPTSTVATYAYINPVVAVVLGTLMGDQSLSLGVLLGGTAVVSAVAVTLIHPRPRRIEVVPEEAVAEIA